MAVKRNLDHFFTFGDQSRSATAHARGQTRWCRLSAETWSSVLNCPILDTTPSKVHQSARNAEQCRWTTRYGAVVVAWAAVVVAVVVTVVVVAAAVVVA